MKKHYSHITNEFSTTPNVINTIWCDEL